MPPVRCSRLRPPGRTPHGVRGLKYAGYDDAPDVQCRTPHGVRGLKFQRLGDVGGEVARRTPHGVRGLKL